MASVQGPMERDVLTLGEKLTKADSTGDVLTLPGYPVTLLFDLFEDKNYIFSIFVSPAASTMPKDYHEQTLH